MSTVRRSIVINPVEPSPLSFRVGTAVDTNLNITLYDQHDPPQPISVDVNAQLQMISRSNDGITTTYAAPGTDIANGKVAVSIPASDMTDPNGYQVYLYGTLAGDGQMLARGVALLDYFQPATPAPIDVIDTIPMTLDRSLADPTVYTVKLWVDTAKTIPVDLTSATVSAFVYNANGGTILQTFATAMTPPNIAQLTLTQAQIATLPNACWWALSISNAGGSTTLAQGSVTVINAVPPAFVTLTANWDYQMPSTGAPSSGQIVHLTTVQDQLLISVTDHDGIDRTATLAMLRLNDQIVSGSQVWNVTQAVNNGATFTVYVNPYTQLGAAGVASFTMQRP